MRLLEAIKTGNASWSDYSRFLELKKNELVPFFKLAQKLTQKYFGNKIKVYIPNKRFPAISITGSECALECEHCNKKYLDGMKHICTSDELEEFLLNLAKNGGVGALLSGGCEPNGSVPLLNFLDSVKRVKNQSNLIINTHTGLLNEKTAQKLVDANVDIVSFDINMDEEIVRDIYHLDVDLNEYKLAIDLLKKYDLNIVPHVCVGLYYGKLHKELDSLKFIKEARIDPSLIVVIALIPPKTSKKMFQQPKPMDIAKIIALIRFIFPETEISLGCMRPRGKIKVDIEINAIKAGITRIEIPSPRSLTVIKEEFPDISFKYYSACCAIPSRFEKFAASKEQDIKRYQTI